MSDNALNKTGFGISEDRKEETKDYGTTIPGFNFGTSTECSRVATASGGFSFGTATGNPSTKSIFFGFGTPTNPNLNPLETTKKSVRTRIRRRYPRKESYESHGAEGSIFNFWKPTNQQSNQQPNSSATGTPPPNEISSQEKDPATIGDLEVVGELTINLSFPTKYIWTIEELPEREGFYGVNSPKFKCGFEEWCMRLYSSGLPPENTKMHDPPNNSLALVFKNIEPRGSVPEDVILAIVPCSKKADNLSGSNHWMMNVKLIDKTLLKSYRCRRNFEDGILRSRYFVLPLELAERILSPFDKKRSIICELSCEPGEEPNAETATQTELIPVEPERKPERKKLQFEALISSQTGIDQLSRDLRQLLVSGDASDATVRVKKREFPVHRNILAARTPVFSAMFKHKMSESETGVVNIDDCEPDTFERFLQYVYTGKVEDLSPGNASALYEVADKYQVTGLKADCLKCIKNGLSVRTLCDAVSLALRYDETELTKLASDFFSLNIKDILTTVEWQNFLAKNPTRANELLIKAHQ